MHVDGEICFVLATDHHVAPRRNWSQVVPGYGLCARRLLDFSMGLLFLF